MDVRCRHCGEPWDHDCLHDEAGARYGVPFYLSDADARAFRRNPAYDSEAYGVVFAAVSAAFRSQGCMALTEYGGSDCRARGFADDRRDSTFGLTAAEASGALYDLLGDDMDGAAAMLEDMGF